MRGRRLGRWRPLALADFHSKSIDIHHIFPKRWCKRDADPVIPPRLYDSIINKTPIDSYTNRIIGGNAPSKYLPLLRKDYIDGETLRRILKAHWIDPDRLEDDDFGYCFAERGQAMLALINRTMGKPIVDRRQVFRDELNSASLMAEHDDYDEVEHDPMGEGTYSVSGLLDRD